MKLTVTLPLPPSANKLTKNLKGGGRATTRDYHAWQEAARFEIRDVWMRAGKPRFLPDRPLGMVLEVGLRTRDRDLGNCLKAVEDIFCKTLGRAGENVDYPDDRWNDKLVLLRDPTVVGVRVTVAHLPEEKEGAGQP